MEVTTLLPLIAGGLFIAYGATIALNDKKLLKNAWLLPASVSFLFFVFSLYAISQEGVLGFAHEHVGTFWENQITFDLLLAAGVAWFYVASKAKALNMKLLPWLALIATTGSIGLLAMVARVMYLEDQG